MCNTLFKCTIYGFVFYIYNLQLRYIRRPASIAEPCFVAVGRQLQGCGLTKAISAWD